MATSDARKRQQEVQAAFNERRCCAPFDLREDEPETGRDCEAWREDYPEPDWHKEDVVTVPSFDDACKLPEGTPFTIGAPEPEQTRFDVVQQPRHYTHSNIEVWDAIAEWGLNYFLGNVVKYVARADHKGNPIEDLEKARAYIDREIERRKALEPDLLMKLAGMDEHGRMDAEQYEWAQRTKRLPDPVDFR